MTKEFKNSSIQKKAKVMNDVIRLAKIKYPKNIKAQAKYVSDVMETLEKFA